MQGIIIEDRYYYREIIRDSVIQIAITNNRDSTDYLSKDYEKNTKVIPVNKDFCVPNKIKVLYFYLVPRYCEDAISDPKCFLSLLGMNPDLELGSRNPVFYTNGPLEK